MYEILYTYMFHMQYKFELKFVSLLLLSVNKSQPFLLMMHMIKGSR